VLYCVLQLYLIMSTLMWAVLTCELWHVGLSLVLGVGLVFCILNRARPTVHTMYILQAHPTVWQHVWTPNTPHLIRVHFLSAYIQKADVVALLIGRRTCDLQVAGSSPGWTPLGSGLGQATYTCVPLPSSSIISYRPRGWSLWLGK